MARLEVIIAGTLVLVVLGGIVALIWSDVAEDQRKSAIHVAACIEHGGVYAERSCMWPEVAP